MQANHRGYVKLITEASQHVNGNQFGLIIKITSATVQFVLASHLFACGMMCIGSLFD
jgi:hypothetical protein